MTDSNKPAFLQNQEVQQPTPAYRDGKLDTPPGGATAYMRESIIDAHVEGMSIEATWEKSYLCTCRNKATRQPAQACPICHGRGVAYLPSKDLRMIIQSQEKGVLNGDLGLLDSGTAIGTPDRQHRISFRDRITVPVTEISQSLIFDATERRIGHGFYLIYKVNEIELAVSGNNNLIEGEDYEFDEVKNLFYPKEHLKGQNISINILTELRYHIADLLKEHRYSRNQAGEGIQMPQKLLMKREDTFVDREFFEPEDEDEIEEGQMVETKRPPAEGLNGFFGGGGNG